jgi:tetratricopeptide (TPR) repeat protein
MMPGVQPDRARWIQRLLEADLPWRLRVEAACYGAPAQELMRSSRLLFNHSIRGEANIRVFEALYCGTPVVMEVENGEIRELLAAKSEYLPYHSENFAEELWQLLQDPQRYASLQQGAARRLPELDPAAWSRRLVEHLKELQSEWQGLESRGAAGWSTHRREGEQGLQRLLCPTHVTADREAAEQLRRWLQGCSDAADLGLFFTSQALALQLDPTALAQFERIFAQLNGQPRGAIWRLFNRAVVQQRNRLPKEEGAWRELLALLDTHPGPDAWIGHGGVQPTDHFWSPLQASLWNQRVPGLFEAAPTPSALLSAWANGRLAELAYAQRDPRTALAWAEAALASHATAAAYCLQGRCRLDLEQPGALESFREACRLEPFHPDASLYLMLLLERDGAQAELAPLIRTWSRGMHLAQVMYRLDESRLDEQRAVIAKCRVSLGLPKEFRCWGGPDAE